MVYSSSKWHYIGLKLTLSIDSKTIQPLAVLIHEKSQNDAKLFSEILKKLSKRKIIRKHTMLIFGRGYFSRNNYQIWIIKYKIIPLIFPRGKNPIKKIFDNISYPLKCFKEKNRNKKLYKSLTRKSRKLIEKWKDYKGLRSKIEDFFKLAKKRLGLNKIHRYIRNSIYKTAYFTVLLAGIITSLGYRRKKVIQQLSEM